MKRKKVLNYATKCQTDQVSNIHFICRMMVTMALPHSRVDGTIYQRVNKDFKLTITNGYEDGILPYGSYPRIIFAWIITEAIKKKSREIYIGDSISDFMKQLGLSVSGGKTGSFNRFKQQFLGLMTSNITYSFIDPQTHKNVIINFHIADAVRFTKKSGEFFRTKVLLDELFFNEIIKYPIPVDKDALNVLMSSSLALDIYFWLTYRMSYLKKELFISFEDLKAQFGFGYDDTKYGKYEFKRKFTKQLRAVLSLYDAAKVDVTTDGIILSPSPTHISKTGASNRTGIIGGGDSWQG